ncbi:hypothetical protein HanXRQr2_Chr13g0592461 [Helianthus annuus]|uniref:Uncharacterized protein n=1 Tax=Helianthus annuus TaxID=4232 RepID=A0A9K3EHC8_HELAN|nr:hypothetical protein HanXRQr2_Chr13g0592461 [Helianthus annuus]
MAPIVHSRPGFLAIYVPFLHLHCFASRRMFSAAEGVFIYTFNVLSALSGV